MPDLLQDGGFASDAICRLRTEWQLCPGGSPNDERLTIILSTREMLKVEADDNSEKVSAISHADVEIPINRRANFWGDLRQVHPTFGIHQQIVESAVASPGSLAEVVISEFLHFIYDKPDRQYRDKRMDIVHYVLTVKRANSCESLASSCMRIWRNQYEQSGTSMLNRTSRPGWHRAYIALGSNLADRISMIETACREMRNQGIVVMRSSALYETQPMYLEDQQPFINGACKVCRIKCSAVHVLNLITFFKIETTLNPLELLDSLKEIEAKLGRVKTVENGPRTIDLDVLMYDEDRVTNERLTIPHERMFEREFVLRPLCE